MPDDVATYRTHKTKNAKNSIKSGVTNILRAGANKVKAFFSFDTFDGALAYA